MKESSTKINAHDSAPSSQVKNLMASTGPNLDSFDDEAFTQTRTLLKSELGEAIEEYLEDAWAYIRDIEDGIRTQNFEKVARGSHPLKSNSKGFGLSAVCDIAEALNSICDRQDIASAACTTMDTLCNKLKTSLEMGEQRLRIELKAASFQL